MPPGSHPTLWAPAAAAGIKPRAAKNREKNIASTEIIMTADSPLPLARALRPPQREEQGDLHDLIIFITLFFSLFRWGWPQRPGDDRRSESESDGHGPLAAAAA